MSSSFTDLDPSFAHIAMIAPDYYEIDPPKKDFYDPVLEILHKEFPKVRLEVLAASAITDTAIKRLDGIIMPGGGDSYPSEAPSFSAKELPKVTCLEEESAEPCLTPTEAAYQKVYALADQYEIPTMGICLGNQYLALHKGEHLHPVLGYGYREFVHSAHFIKGSLSHLYTLSEEELKAATGECKVPAVSLPNIITAHEYAILPPSGTKSEMRVDALSEEGVVQATSYGDRHVGFQFHPEAYDKDMPERPKNIFRNFMRAALQHHAAVQNAQGNSKRLQRNLRVIKERNEWAMQRIHSCLETSLNPFSWLLNSWDRLEFSLYDIPDFSNHLRSSP